ncbi:hypothetical protein HID58_063706 [Brassica napus]|uniref:Ion transport domain-containing protein n=1 Tax=Brassica napus TaxID=3708 RepID=A0ABQ7XF26_BRANA|nr:hypothetical protein HID58_063706 [Brassica napus]
MGYGNSRSVRFEEDSEVTKPQAVHEETAEKLKFKINGAQISPRKNVKKMTRGKSFKAKVLSRVFTEDLGRVKNKILDPRGQTIRRWNKLFLIACLVSLFVDPLFFFLPVMRKEACITIGIRLEVVLTVIRSLADAFYIAQIVIRFRTAYIAPSSRVFGRGELVIDSRKIAWRYLNKSFWIHLVAALPLPQVLIWIVIPNLRGSPMTNTKNTLRFIIIFQYVPRMFLIFPLSRQIIKATGVVTETAWAGAAYNLMLYMLASHVLGACWYLLAVERQEACWRHACNIEKPICQYRFFECRRLEDPQRNSWFEWSNITTICKPGTRFYEFGIYGDAVTSTVTSSNFINKYFYCLWWGLKNLSSLGQNLSTSTYVGEIIFAVVMASLGLVLFALLIGNMQTYLQSTTMRLEEWRIRRTDTEQWMHHRQLPPELRQAVRKYDQYKWLATRGVDEEALLISLPLDLRRDIKRHLCFDLVRRVPLFDQMDERMLDAISERLKPALCTEGTFLVREGDPDQEISARRGVAYLGVRSSPRCDLTPSSTRTVKAIYEVEAFALRADDLMFVATQFRRLHSKQLKHKFRFYSHQWRTWAACFIQAAWRRHKKRKYATELRVKEEFQCMFETASMVRLNSGKFTRSGSDSGMVSSIQKPVEPDFSRE